MYDDIFEDEIVGIEIILSYLSRLKDMNEDRRFEEIGREKIVESIDQFVSESDEDLCSIIDKYVLELGDPELCYEMAANISWVDIKKYGQAVIDSKDIENNYFFAVNIGEADVLKHGEVIIESLDPEYNYLFALYAPGANVSEHGKAVIKSKDVWYNYVFALEVVGADILGHGRVIIDSKDLYYNYTFAEEIDGCDVKGHCDVLLNSNEREKYINKAIDETQYHLYPYLGIEKGKVKEKNRKN